MNSYNSPLSGESFCLNLFFYKNLTLSNKLYIILTLNLEFFIGFLCIK